MSVLVSNSVKGKYSAVTLSIILVFVDLYVMVLYNYSRFCFLGSKRTFSREFLAAA